MASALLRVKKVFLRSGDVTSVASLAVRAVTSVIIERWAQCSGLILNRSDYTLVTVVDVHIHEVAEGVRI
jgi:hypothetical protein